MVLGNFKAIFTPSQIFGMKISKLIFWLFALENKDIDQFASKWLCLQIPRENLSDFG